jgi:hypothetical protein
MLVFITSWIAISIIAQTFFIGASIASREC